MNNEDQQRIRMIYKISPLLSGFTRHIYEEFIDKYAVCIGSCGQSSHKL